MSDNEAFLGKGWNFPPWFSRGGAEVAMVAAEEDIQQSLSILLSTSIDERTMFSSYGCDLRRYQFAEIDQELVNGLKSMVSNAILNNEPRVQTDSVEVDQHPSEAGLLLIAVYYTVRATNNRYNLVFPFYINEASVPVA
ncbi:MAG: GPW/gp25 family protein [Williamsia sp.]|nr:GPW/gp25 family protein [Williamsia sp.]